MNYFFVEGTFKHPVPVSEGELKAAIAEHIRYLQKGFDNGWILVSGPKAISGGGVILMKAPSKDEVETYLANDPLKTAGVQDYIIVEFKLHDAQPITKQWFD